MITEGALSASIVSNLKKEILTGKLANGTGPVSAELRLQKCDRLRAHLRSLPPESKQHATLCKFLEALQLQDGTRNLISSEAEQGREHTTGEVNRVIAEIGKLRKDMQDIKKAGFSEAPPQASASGANASTNAELPAEDPQQLEEQRQHVVAPSAEDPQHEQQHQHVVAPCTKDQ